MRAKNVSFNLFLILLFAIGFINCFKDFETKKVKLYVTSHNDLFSAETSQGSPFAEKIKIRENLQGRWNIVPFNNIKNFEYKKGYNYELLVKRDQDVQKGEMNQNYSLIKVLSKQKDIEE